MHPLVVSRQPIVDGRLKVVGYRLIRAPLALDAFGGPGDLGELGAAIEDALQVVAKSEHAAGVRVHVRLGADEVLAGAFPKVARDRIVLWIDYADALDPDVRAGLESAAYRGYFLGLTKLPGKEFDRDALGPIGIVDFDLSVWTVNAAAIAVSELASRGMIALASGVESHAQRRIAHSVGFERFVGPFYTTPEIVPGVRIPVGDIATIVQLAQAHGPGTTIDDLVSVIDRDVALSVKLLQYINSAYFGLATRVTSIRHAVALLGPRGISRWAMIVMLLDRSPPIRRELGLIALVRARMCELLGAGDEGEAGSRFTVGLLSAADAVLGSPMPQILDEMPLAAEVHDALLSHSGELGATLAEVLAFEHGAFTDPAIHTPLARLGEVYREALVWARASQSGLA